MKSPSASVATTGALWSPAVTWFTPNSGPIDANDKSRRGSRLSPKQDPPLPRARFAVAAAHYQCVNKGGNCPAAVNKQDVLANVSASGDFSSGKNGAINGSLTFSPPPSSLNCPGGQRLKMTSVAYAGIALTDDTFHVTRASTPEALSMSGPECP